MSRVGATVPEGTGLKLIRRNWILILAALGIIAAFAAFRLNQKPEAEYFTAKVEQGDIRQVIEATGTINLTIAQDLTKMYVYAKTDEGDVGQIRPGHSADFQVDAFPKEVFHGVVSQVRMNATTLQNVVTYDTIVEFVNPDMKLFPGMTAYVSIPVASVSNVVKIPNAALRYKPDLPAEQVQALYSKYGISASHTKQPSRAADTPSQQPGGGTREHAASAATSPSPAEPSSSSDDSVEVFFAYSHSDTKLRDQLEMHLAPLKREGLIKAWHDRKIAPGTAWQQQIDLHLESARIIILLISADFLNSDYCYCDEMQKALRRDRLGVARVIPVIARDADWQTSPFSKLQALPSKDGRIWPIKRWADRDAALTSVAASIRRTVKELAGK